MLSTRSALNLGRLLRNGAETILLALLLIALSFILNSVTAHAGVRLSLELEGAALRSCTENRKDCVELKAQKLKGSQLKLLYGFKDGTIHLSKGRVSTTWAAIDGYWDGAGDLLIFSTKDADVSVDLKTLSVSEYPRQVGKR